MARKSALLFSSSHNNSEETPHHHLQHWPNPDIGPRLALTALKHVLAHAVTGGHCPLNGSVCGRRNAGQSFSDNCHHPADISLSCRIISGRIIVPSPPQLPCRENYCLFSQNSGVSGPSEMVVSGAGGNSSSSSGGSGLDSAAYILCMIQQKQQQLLDAAANGRSKLDDALGTAGGLLLGNSSSSATATAASSAVLDLEELYSRG
ncbi:hypothetical protein TYRP_018504 [Tyrophagus putrescentiae]|nr:hypothetical protein TYRP_018504 [Tyrophagus putrescentiae]